MLTLNRMGLVRAAGDSKTFTTVEQRWYVVGYRAGCMATPVILAATGSEEQAKEMRETFAQHLEGYQRIVVEQLI